MTALRSFRIGLATALALAAAAHSSRAAGVPRIRFQPVCPPYCCPTFGYYPTAWRPWPSVTPDGYVDGCVPELPAPVPEGKDKPADVGHRAAAGRPVSMSLFRP